MSEATAAVVRLPAFIRVLVVQPIKSGTSKMVSRINCRKWIASLWMNTAKLSRSAFYRFLIRYSGQLLKGLIRPFTACGSIFRHERLLPLLLA